MAGLVDLIKTEGDLKKLKELTNNQVVEVPSRPVTSPMLNIAEQDFYLSPEEDRRAKEILKQFGTVSPINESNRVNNEVLLEQNSNRVNNEVLLEQNSKDLLNIPGITKADVRKGTDAAKASTTNSMFNDKEWMDVWDFRTENGRASIMLSALGGYAGAYFSSKLSGNSSEDARQVAMETAAESFGSLIDQSYRNEQRDILEGMGYTRGSIQGWILDGNYDKLKRDDLKGNRAAVKSGDAYYMKGQPLPQGGYATVEGIYTEWVDGNTGLPTRAVYQGPKETTGYNMEDQWVLEYNEKGELTGREELVYFDPRNPGEPIERTGQFRLSNDKNTESGYNLEDKWINVLDKDGNLTNKEELVYIDPRNPTSVKRTGQFRLVEPSFTWRPDYQAIQGEDGKWYVGAGIDSNIGKEVSDPGVYEVLYKDGKPVAANLMNQGVQMEKFRKEQEGKSDELVEGLISSADTMVLISEALGLGKAMDTSSGVWNYFPTIHGSSTADFNNMINQISSGQLLENLRDAKAAGWAGSMTNAEIEIIKTLQGNLSDPGLSRSQKERLLDVAFKKLERSFSSRFRKLDEEDQDYIRGLTFYGRHNIGNISEEGSIISSDREDSYPSYLKPGYEKDGYRYVGGNPNNKDNWTFVGG